MKIKMLEDAVYYILSDDEREKRTINQGDVVEINDTITKQFIENAQKQVNNPDSHIKMSAVGVDFPDGGFGVLDVNSFEIVDE